MNVYGRATPRASTPAAELASGAVTGADRAAQLPRDLSDANLGLLEVPDQQEQPVQAHSEAPDPLRAFQDQLWQPQPQSVGTPAGSAGQSGQGGLEPVGRVPARPSNPVRNVQQQPQQRLYSGPGTVAPPPSALPHPGSLTCPQAPPSYSAIAGGQAQANASPVLPAHAYHDLSDGREHADAGAAKPAAHAQEAAGLPSGQWAAAGAQQQPGQLPREAAANHIATPDNSAGLNAWQVIADGQQCTGNTAAASAGTAPGAGLFGLPGLSAGSFMREGESASRAGGFLGRDLFANQRSELSRRASPASMWEAADQTHAAPVPNPQLQPSGVVLNSHASSQHACPSHLWPGMVVWTTIWRRAVRICSGQGYAGGSAGWPD